jgi:hypothetical protein
MTWDDSDAFVLFLIEQFSAEFVPYRSENPPPFPRYATAAEVRFRIDEDVSNSHVPRFQVLSPQWEELPLEFNEVHANDGQHYFCVSQRYGGPAFDLIVSRSYGDGEGRWIVAGSFGDYSYYIADRAFLTNPSLYRTVPRPATMVSAHKEIGRYLRRNGCRSVCRETGQVGPWVLPGALREFDAGIWLRCGDWHYEPRRQANKRQR